MRIALGERETVSSQILILSDERRSNGFAGVREQPHRIG